MNFRKGMTVTSPLLINMGGVLVPKPWEAVHSEEVTCSTEGAVPARQKGKSCPERLTDQGWARLGEEWWEC